MNVDALKMVEYANAINVGKVIEASTSRIKREYPTWDSLWANRNQKNIVANANYVPDNPQIDNVGKFAQKNVLNLICVGQRGLAENEIGLAYATYPLTMGEGAFYTLVLDLSGRVYQVNMKGTDTEDVLARLMQNPYDWSNYYIQQSRKSPDYQGNGFVTQVIELREPQEIRAQFDHAFETLSYVPEQPAVDMTTWM